MVACYSSSLLSLASGVFAHVGFRESISKISTREEYNCGENSENLQNTTSMVD